ncbi:i-AAA protease yme1 [Hypoxylon texense]
MVRRSTTAAPRRKVSAADIFTACYTTILGTATVIDAHRKEARKKELDEKLEKARAALCSLGVQESAEQQDGGGSRPDAVVVPERRPRDPNRTRSATPNFPLRELGALSEITRRPPPPTSWMETQLEWAHIEAAIATEEQDPGYTLREPKSASQLHRTTAVVVELVNRLLQRSASCESTRRQDGEVDEQSIRRECIAWAELEGILQSPNYPSYHLPFIEPDDTAWTRSLLGNSIRRIFNQAASSKETVAKICYNILASSAPPTIHTYNTLIAGFNRIERPDLAQMVVDSYIHDTAWPATQQTIVCLLSHYRGTNQVNGIRDVISRMRGTKDTGLHFRIISKDAIYSSDWLEWAEKDCASRKHAFVERARRNGEIFDNIIKSWLHCGEVGNASMTLIACLRNGYSVTAQTLQKLFAACLATADFAAAWRLVKGFTKHRHKFATFIHNFIHQEPIATSRQVMRGLSHVLDMCWLPLEDNFGPVAKTLSRTAQELKSFIHRTQLEFEMQGTRNLPLDTLNAISPSDSLSSGPRRDIVVPDLAPLNGQRVVEASANFGTLGKLLSIDRTYQDLKTKIKTTTSLVNAVILKIKTGYDFNISFLESNGPHSPHYQQRHDDLCHALQKIIIYPGPMTKEDIRLQLLRNLPDPALVRQFKNSGNPEKMAVLSLVTFYRPNSYTSPKPNSHTHNKFIRQLEEQFAQIEDTVRAILFAHLRRERQKRVRYLYPNWHDTSIPKLVEYHMRRSICKASTAADSKQTNTTRSRDQENPAKRMAENMSTAFVDAYRPNPTKLLSAGPSVLHPAFAALG